MFERRLRRNAPAVRRELGLPSFPVASSRQLTVHGAGRFFTPHVDRRLRHRRESPDLVRLLLPPHSPTLRRRRARSSTTPRSHRRARASAPPIRRLAPVDNSIVFFPSDAFHEVCPVHTDADAFDDSRFTVTIWFRAAQHALPARRPSRRLIDQAGADRTACRFITAWPTLSIAHTTSVLRPAGMRSRPSGSHGDGDIQLPYSTPSLELLPLRRCQRRIGCPPRDCRHVSRRNTCRGPTARPPTPRMRPGRTNRRSPAGRRRRPAHRIAFP